MNYYILNTGYKQFTRPVTNWLERHTAIIFSLFILTFLVLDTTTTLIGLELGFREANHTSSVILATAGYGGFIAVKLALTGVLCGGYLWSRHYSVTLIALAYGIIAGIAAVWNTVNIALFLVVMS